MTIYPKTLTFKGGSRVFKKSDKLQEWLNNELEQWGDFHSRLPAGDLFRLKDKYDRELLVHQINPIREAQIFIQGESNGDFELGGEYITSDSSFGKTVLQLAKEDVGRAAILYTYRNIHSERTADAIRSILNSSDKRDAAALNKHVLGLVDSYLFEKNLLDVNNAQSEVLKDLSSRYQTALNETAEQQASDEEFTRQVKERFSQLDQEIIAKNNERFELLEKQLEETRQRFTKELALQIPVHYWTEKCKEHKLLVRRWSMAFVGCSVGMLAAYPLLMKYAVSTVMGIFSTHKGDTTELTANVAAGHYDDLQTWLLFISISFPLFVAIWILRLIAKTLLSHQKQKDDASVRTVMTMTYLALLDQNKASEDDKILILNALFHVPAHNNDDGSPPHWFELLQARGGVTKS